MYQIRPLSKWLLFCLDMSAHAAIITTSKASNESGDVMKHYTTASVSTNGSSERLSVATLDKSSAMAKLKMQAGLDGYTGLQEITQNEHHKLIMSGMAREVR